MVQYLSQKFDPSPKVEKVIPKEDMISSESREIVLDIRPWRSNEESVAAYQDYCIEVDTNTWYIPHNLHTYYIQDIT